MGASQRAIASPAGDALSYQNQNVSRVSPQVQQRRGLLLADGDPERIDDELENPAK
jgi:hypothetical protein